MQIDFRKKWHWMAGGAFALLFLLLLSFRLGFFRENPAAVRNMHLAVGVLPAKDDAWFTISQGRRKIGYAHRRFFPTEAGYRLTEEVLLRINTMGVVQALNFQTEGNLDSRLTLTSFNFRLNSSLFRFAARGVVRDRLLTLHAGVPGEERKLEIILREPLHLSSGIFDVSRFAGLQPGESRTFHVFDPVAMGERPVRLSLSEGEEVILHQGRKKRARKVSLDFMGTTQFAWLGEDGAVLKEQGILGITLERSAKQEALEDIEPGESADLTELASIPANKTIGDPDSVRELRVRLGNLGDTAFFLDGGRQTLQKDILLIRKEAIPAAGRGDKIGRDSPSLKPSPLIQSDHPLIVGKAREIVSKSDTDEAKAGKIVNWVYKHVKKRPVLSVPNALETLTNLVGDCNEHAVLVAALARAAGIPAEVEAGLVYLRGRFYYHAWNVLYLGEWITADAVFGQMPADVTHLRFVRGATERQIDLLGLVGRVHLEILDGFVKSQKSSPP
jgi:hypothetical protein